MALAEPVVAGAPTFLQLSIVLYFVKPAPFLNEALASIASQLVDDVELVVVAGHSPEEELGIAPEFEASIDRLIVEPDRGGWDAANKGWRAARGRWVQFCMSDDWLPEGSILKTLQALDRFQSAQLLSGGMSFVAARRSGERRVIRSVQAQPLSFARVLDDLCSPSIIYRRDLLERLGGFDGRFGFSHDRELLLRAWRLGVEHRAMAHETYRMRVHALSRTNSGDKKVRLSYLSEHVAFADELLARRELAVREHEKLTHWRDEEFVKYGILRRLSRGRAAPALDRPITTPRITAAVARIARRKLKLSRGR
jgi:glycosyltransferase involved in cell wall biosynthesis